MANSYERDIKMIRLAVENNWDSPELEEFLRRNGLDPEKCSPEEAKKVIDRTRPPKDDRRGKR